MKEFKIIFILYLTTLLLVITGCNHQVGKSLELKSPDGKLTLKFTTQEGQPYYQLSKNEEVIIAPSQMGFKFFGKDSIFTNLEITSQTNSTKDETWEQPWGEKRFIKNNYNELSVTLTEKSGKKRTITAVFRLFDDGLGFRYIIPEQPNLKEFEVADELTQFNFTTDNKAWWIPAYKPERYEYLYHNTPVSALDTVHTPLTIEMQNGLFVSIHEAALIDYGSMTLCKSGANNLKADITPWHNGVKAWLKAPFTSPWRTIQVAETPGGLITSYLILNLNEPNKLGDISWIKPGKYVGIWWEMHIGKSTWNNGPKHGANNQNVKRYIDFAAANNFQGVLVEGWNEGWENWNFNFTTPYPDFDISALSTYAQSKGVNLIGHHETGGNVINYDNQLEDAFALYKKNNIHYVKTGYVGPRMDNKEFHHSQYGVRHYQKTIEIAAKNHVMVDIHEPIKDTGLRRTYPNLMTREGVRGMEWNAWASDGGNPPAHETVIPFTRGLAGPIDYTPGIFDITIPEKPNNQVNTTLAKQLALMVVLYSPLQMAADLPEHYLANPKPFEFIKHVPCDWEHTQVLNGEIGKFITTVRKERGGNNWYLGAITNEEPRTITISLSFLDTNKKYKATIYADGQSANYKTNPLDITIKSEEVTSQSSLTLQLAAGGGAAIEFVEIK